MAGQILDRSFACRKHNVPLRAELDTKNYVLGECFCKDVENDGRAHAKPLAEFETIKHSLERSGRSGSMGVMAISQ
jgi:hypothetical protein